MLSALGRIASASCPTARLFTTTSAQSCSSAAQHIRRGTQSFNSSYRIVSSTRAMAESVRTSPLRRSAASHHFGSSTIHWVRRSFASARRPYQCDEQVERKSTVRRVALEPHHDESAAGRHTTRRCHASATLHEPRHLHQQRHRLLLRPNNERHIRQRAVFVRLLLRVDDSGAHVRERVRSL